MAGYYACGTFIYDFNLNTQGFVYLEFVKYQQGNKRASIREMRCMHICYTAVLYTDMTRLSSYIEINRISFRC